MRQINNIFLNLFFFLFQRELENMQSAKATYQYLKNDKDKNFEEIFAQNEDEQLDSKDKELLKKIKKVRSITSKIVKDMQHLRTDKEREMYLIQRFIVESMSGFKKTIALQYFSKNIDSSENVHKFRLRVFSLIALIVYILVIFAMIFYYGVYVGPAASNTWLLCIGIAFFQDVFFLQPVKIWVKWIVITAPAVKDVNIILSGLRDRVRYVLLRKTGLMHTSHADIQHFNAACRAARYFPSLPVSRLLFSLNDWDAQEGWDLNKTVVDHLFGGLVGLVAAFTHVPFAMQDLLVELIVAISMHLIIVVLYFMLTTSLLLSGILALVLIGLFLLSECLNWYRRRRMLAKIKPNDNSSSSDDEDDKEDKNKYVIARKKKKKPKSAMVVKAKTSEKFDFEFDDLFSPEEKTKVKPSPVKSSSPPSRVSNEIISKNELFSGVFESLDLVPASIISMTKYESIIKRKAEETNRPKRLRISRIAGANTVTQTDKSPESVNNNDIYLNGLTEITEIIQDQLLEYYRINKNSDNNSTENSLSHEKIQELEDSQDYDYHTQTLIAHSKIYNIAIKRIEKLLSLIHISEPTRPY